MTSTNIKSQIKVLQTDLMIAFSWTEDDVNKFWFMSNPLLSNKTPHDMSQNEADFRKLKTLIKISTTRPRGF